MLPNFIKIREISFYHYSTNAFESVLSGDTDIGDPTFTFVSDSVSRSMFERLEFSSGIDNIYANGILVLRDRGDLVGKLNPSGKDIIKVVITSDDDASEQIEQYYVASECSYSSGATDRKHTKLVTFKLLSLNLYRNERAINSPNITELKYGFIDNSNLMFNRICNNAGFYYSDTGTGPSTRTCYYLKNKNLIYPNNRVTDDSPMSHLLYMSKYALPENPENNYPSYFVYDDANTSLQFKNIIPEDPEAVTYQKKFIIGNINTIQDKEVPFEIKPTKQFSFSELINSGALSSYYECVFPDFYKPYIDFLGNTEYVKTNIEYNITDLNPNFANLCSVNDRGLSYTLVDEVIDGITLFYSAYIPTKRFVDNKPYGYYDTTYLNLPYEPVFNVYANIDSPKTTLKIYQTMFDIFPYTDDFLNSTNAPGITSSKAMISNIIQILDSVENAKKTYHETITLKEQYNVFKYVLCCLEGEGPDDGGAAFDAVVKYDRVLTNSSDTKHPVYLYTFKEVEFVPIDFNVFFSGYDTSLSGITIVGGSLAGVTIQGITLDISKYDTFYWPTGAVTTVFDITLGMAGVADSAKKHNIHYILAGKKDGRSGYCFNTNEMMNFHIDSESLGNTYTYFNNGITLGATGFYYGGSGYDLSLKQLILRTNTSGTIVDTFAFNDYRIMPIGCNKQNWSIENGGEYTDPPNQASNTKCNIRSRHHVTKITQKNITGLGGLTGLTYTCVGITALVAGVTQNLTICPNTKYYLFDVQNAIDGFCGIECEQSDNTNPIFGIQSTQSNPFSFIKPLPTGYTAI